MGITLSVASSESAAAASADGESGDSLTITQLPKNDGIKLKLSERDLEKLINTYFKHQFLSFVPVEGLRNLFEVSFGHKALLEENSQFLDVLTTSQNVFPDELELTISIQEVLVGLVLLCDAPWSNRVALLFNIFKCVGSEEIGFEDLILAGQMVVVVLCRLWGVPRWSAKTVNALTEAIADGAFTQLGLEIDECIDQSRFVAWMMERFRESNVVDSAESLRRLYQAPHA